MSKVGLDGGGDLDHPQVCSMAKGLLAFISYWAAYWESSYVDIRDILKCDFSKFREALINDHM